jgi:hypothetical protein
MGEGALLFIVCYLAFVDAVVAILLHPEWFN